MDDFELEEFTAEPEESADPDKDAGVHVLKEASPARQTVNKKIKGINWVFPYMSCENGILEGSKCVCSVNAPAFLEDHDCCFIKDENNPKAQPKLCPEYKQK